MTGEALSKIGGFIPRLEKVYLDDIFTDTNYLSRYTTFSYVNLIAKISNLNPKSFPKNVDVWTFVLQNQANYTSVEMGLIQ